LLQNNAKTMQNELQLKLHGPHLLDLVERYH